MDMFHDGLKAEPDDLMVLGHGDCKNLNMMFLKDKHTNKIKHHVLIDFQVTQYKSFALDLGFYLFSSVQPKVRQNHLQELLMLYMETVNTVTMNLGYPTNWTFPVCKQILLRK